MLVCRVIQLTFQDLSVELCFRFIVLDVLIVPKNSKFCNFAIRKSWVFTSKLSDKFIDTDPP